MQTLNTLWNSLDSLRFFMKEHALQDSAQLLVRIHTSIHSMDSISPLLELLCQHLPSATIIGSSNAGVIFNGEILYDQCLLSFSLIENATIQTQLFDTQNKDAITLAKEVEASNLLQLGDAAFLFYSNNFHSVGNFIKECDHFAKHVKMVGGGASTMENPTLLNDFPSFVFHNTHVSSHGCVIASLQNPSLHLYSNAILGVEHIGQSYTITKTDGLFIEEINDQDASKWYRNHLDEASFSKDSTISHVFPFVLPQHNDSIRIIYYNEESDRIHWIDEPSVNEEIRFSYCSPNVAIQECRNVCSQIEHASITSLFVYSCYARTQIMNHCSTWELAPFHGTNISGAICIGEIFNIDGHNEYGNCTCSFLGMATKQDCRFPIHQEALDQVQNLEFDNQHILTFLLKSIHDEMYRTNTALSKKLNDQHSQIMNSLFIDAPSQLGNVTKFLYDKEYIDFDKLCIISTQNSAMLRAHYGDPFCHKEFLTKIQRCLTFLDDSDLHLYFHHQDAFMISAAHTYDANQFIVKLKSLFQYLGRMESQENGFYYINEFAVVVNEGNILEKAELTLSSIAHSSQRFLLYYPNLGLENAVNEELRCLAHIKHAILHDGVEPYFQPIYDNVLHVVDRHEALMRLKSKGGELLYPDQFMDIAKKYKLYEELSSIMIDKVMKLYRDRSDSVSINLSVQDIYCESTKERIYENLRKTPTPSHIIFEIVESEEIHRDTILIEFIDNLRSFGAKIAIDDFGSGYSNLLKLVQLQADYIKIDGEIIRHMIHDEKCRQILDTILFLSRQTNTELVAEFVENKEIQEQIEHLNIRYSQGYYFSPPLPFKDI